MTAETKEKKYTKSEVDKLIRKAVAEKLSKNKKKRKKYESNYEKAHRYMQELRDKASPLIPAFLYKLENEFNRMKNMKDMQGKIESNNKMFKMTKDFFVSLTEDYPKGEISVSHDDVGKNTLVGYRYLYSAVFHENHVVDLKEPYRGRMGDFNREVDEHLNSSAKKHIEEKNKELSGKEAVLKTNVFFAKKTSHEYGQIETDVSGLTFLKGAKGKILSVRSKGLQEYIDHNKSWLELKDGFKPLYEVRILVPIDKNHGHNFIVPLDQITLKGKS